MLERFLQYNKDNSLIKEGKTVLAAISGGMDSVVMCDLLFKSKINFSIAHCNFGLRGEESDGDEAFVKKLAKKYKVDFYVNHFETKLFAEQNKISTQMAARELRYNWFADIMKKFNIELLATAHHLNDSLETVLLNLVKGTGITGLHGIKPVNGNIIRPLLFADKELIYEYLAENQLPWREDSSNESIKYQRNLLRNEVVPLLKQINPNLEETISQTIEKVSAVENLFLKTVEESKFNAVTEKEGVLYVNKDKLKSIKEPVIQLAEILKPFNFTFSDAKRLFTLEDVGKRLESGTHIAVNDRTEIVVTAKDLYEFSDIMITEKDKIVTVGDLELEITVKDKADVKITSENNIALLDYEKLSFPLYVRRWKEGDWFFPLGMNKKKKLSDFFIDQKVPLNVKNKILILTSNDSIGWIINYRLDDRFKLKDETTKVLVVKAKSRSRKN